MLSNSPNNPINPQVFRTIVQELPAFSSPIPGLELNISSLGSEFGVSCKLGTDSLCDCAELTEPYRRYRLHFFPNIPNSFSLDVPDHVYVPGRLCQIDSTMEWYINGFSGRIIAYDALMQEDRGSGDFYSALIRTLKSGGIPQGDIAVIPTSDPVLTRALLHLGAEISHSCPFDIELSWKTLVKFAESGEILRAITEMESAEGKIEFIKSPNPHAIAVTQDEFPALVATFFNNAALPGAGAAVAMADSYVTGSSPEISIEEAGIILTEMEEWWFDYFRGRRMKLCLGSETDPRSEILTESFDQCAFSGAGRYLVNRYRRTGEVSLCLEYFSDASGNWQAKRVRD